jgi:excisionase family DNA binding protein
VSAELEARVAELEHQVAELLRDRGDAERLLTADEAAARLHVSRRYVLRLARDGALERVKRGRDVLFPSAAIDRYLEQGRRPVVDVGATAAARLTGDVIELPTVRPRRRERL